LSQNTFTGEEAVWALPVGAPKPFLYLGTLAYLIKGLMALVFMAATIPQLFAS